MEVDHQIGRLLTALKEEGLEENTLVIFTSDREKMGEFVNPAWLKVLSWVVALFIAALNAWLLLQAFKGWLR